MAKYFDSITESTDLKTKIGSAIEVTPDLYIMSSTILSQCTYAQSLIQRIIFTTHGDQLIDAKKALREFPNPKTRIDFLCDFQYTDADPIIYKMFQYARSLFRDIYELRNMLAHEIWNTSEEYPGAVLFSSLDEESRLLIASGRLWFIEQTTPQEVYDATVRFIRSVKIVTMKHLDAAMRDVELCAWILKTIDNVLNENDPVHKEEARKSFLVYGGTSHLFDNRADAGEVIEYTSSKSKTITGN